MTPADFDSKISISHADGDDYLVMRVANGPGHDLHRISLAQARALSLDIIKQVYRSEVINGRDGKPAPSQASSTVPFRFQHQR